jgi:Leucine-rich repeat (LRR) protein
MDLELEIQAELAALGDFDPLVDGSFTNRDNETDALVYESVPIEELMARADSELHELWATHEEQQSLAWKQINSLRNEKNMQLEMKENSAQEGLSMANAVESRMIENEIAPNPLSEDVAEGGNDETAEETSHSVRLVDAWNSREQEAQAKRQAKILARREAWEAQQREMKRCWEEEKRQQEAKQLVEEERRQVQLKQVALQASRIEELLSQEKAAAAVREEATQAIAQQKEQAIIQQLDIERQRMKEEDSFSRRMTAQANRRELAARMEAERLAAEEAERRAEKERRQKEEEALRRLRAEEEAREAERMRQRQRAEQARRRTREMDTLLGGGYKDVIEVPKPVPLWLQLHAKTPFPSLQSVTRRLLNRPLEEHRRIQTNYGRYVGVEPSILSVEEERVRLQVQDQASQLELPKMARLPLELLEEAVGGAEFASVNALDLRLEEVAGLGGLEVFSSLVKLDVSQANLNSLRGIEVLSHLTALSASQNNLCEVTPIKYLTEIQFLKLDVNNIMDLSPLSNLFRLRFLDIKCNSVDSLSSLQKLRQLTHLNAYRNSLTSLRGLEGSANTLTYLDVGRNSLRAVSELAQLRRLQSLMLYSNELVEFPPLNTHPHLHSLFLAGNHLAGDVQLPCLPALRLLFANDNNIRRISGFELVPTLHTLDLSFNQILSLDDLHGWRALRTLRSCSLTDNPMTEAEATWKQCKNLMLAVLPESFRELNHELIDAKERTKAVRALCATAPHLTREYLRTISTTHADVQLLVPYWLSHGSANRPLAHPLARSMAQAYSHHTSTSGMRVHLHLGTNFAQILSNAARLIQRTWRQWHGIQSQLRNIAASVIQFAWVSHRSRLLRLREMQEKQALHRSATRIQATFRGHLLRSRLAKARATAKLADSEWNSDEDSFMLEDTSFLDNLDSLASHLDADDTAAPLSKESEAERQARIRTLRSNWTTSPAPDVIATSHRSAVVPSSQLLSGALAPSASVSSFSSATSSGGGTIFKPNLQMPAGKEREKDRVNHLLSKAWAAPTASVLVTDTLPLPQQSLLAAPSETFVAPLTDRSARSSQQTQSPGKDSTRLLGSDMEESAARLHAAKESRMAEKLMRETNKMESIAQDWGFSNPNMAAGLLKKKKRVHRDANKVKYEQAMKDPLRRLEKFQQSAGGSGISASTPKHQSGMTNRRTIRSKPSWATASSSQGSVVSSWSQDQGEGAVVERDLELASMSSEGPNLNEVAAREFVSDAVHPPRRKVINLARTQTLGLGLPPKGP